MADNTNTIPSTPAALPAITVPPVLVAAVSKYVAANGPLPTSHHAARVAFGHAYPAGTFTSCTDHKVQALVFALRNTGGVGTHSYRTVAAAIGAQCSALTERAYGAHVRRNKLASDQVRTNTGGRAAKLAAAVVPPVKAGK